MSAKFHYFKARVSKRPHKGSKMIRLALIWDKDSRGMYVCDEYYTTHPTRTPNGFLLPELGNWLLVNKLAKPGKDGEETIVEIHVSFEVIEDIK